MRVALLNYTGGNSTSVSYALSRLGVESYVTDDPDQLQKADKVIVPGVGAAKPAMQSIREKGLENVISSLTQPVLGICVGLQIFCEQSVEGASKEATECMGIFPVKVERFKKPKKIPHMGWNTLTHIKGELFKGVSEEDAVYFVHSYRAEVTSDTLSRCNYGEEFSAALKKDNFYATQFHPEKSGRIGATILNNFLAL